jgi:hypothetical protein
MSIFLPSKCKIAEFTEVVQFKTELNLILSLLHQEISFDTVYLIKDKDLVYYANAYFANSERAAIWI